MRILSLQLCEISSLKPKTIDIDANVSVLFSIENSTGKTTLMRAMLYALGFSIPNTELVKFENYIFTIVLSHQNKLIHIKRKQQLLTIDENEFDLPVDQQAAHTYLFGISNPEILSNLLGVIYFDQEKGWTLLNRGTIIGTNRFSIEAFFRGLKEDESSESYEIVEKISTLNKKIAQYNLMLNVAEYQDAINQEGNTNLDYESYDMALDSKLLEYKIELADVEAELSQLNDVIKKNKSFSDYIEMKRIYVKNPNSGPPIPVNKETLLDYDSLRDLNDARKSMLVSKRNTLKRRIAQIESSQEKQLRFMELPTADEELTKRLSKIQGINAVQIKSMLDSYKKDKTALTKVLHMRTKTDNPWIAEAYNIINEYAIELGLPFDYKIDIFTKNLKAKSGAILHKMVFIYKLAYIKLISQKIGYSLPIFCDSPSGREVEKTTINAMLKILARDFSDHQIIIASIYKYEDIFSEANIVQLNGTLFDKTTLFD